MTTTIVVVDADDAYIQSSNLNYSTSLDGAGAIDLIAGTTPFLAYGQYLASPEFGSEQVVLQGFMRFAYTHPANEVVTAASIGLLHSQHHATSVSRALLLYVSTYGPGTPVDADWMTPPEFAVTDRYARYVDAQASGVTQRIWAGSDELTEALATNGTQDVKVVAASDRQIFYGSGPSGEENDNIASSQVPGGQPWLVVSSVPRSTLHGVLGAQVQLSDNTWAVLESNGSSSPTITLRHVNGVGTATTKATIPVGTASTDFGFGVAPGAQQLALIVDPSDNLYVIGRRGDTENTLAVKAYTKGIGYTWTAQAMVTAAMPASDSTLNNFAGDWHSVGSGTLVVFASHTSSDSDRQLAAETVYAVLSGPVALAGTGTLVRASASAVGPMLPQTPYQPWSANSNETGTGLDVTALSATKGAVQTWSRYDALGVNQPTHKVRYTLNSTGTAITSSFGATVNDGLAWAKKSAAGKLRVLPVDSDQAVFLGADAYPGWGLTAWVLRNSGTSTSWTHLGLVRFDNESLSTMPSETTLSESPAWDAIYRTGDSKIWVYYFDVGNGRRLMRTAMSLNTYAATREETELSSTVGASGSTNLAIRVARANATSNAALISVANRTSGGTHSTIYVVDDPNVAPTGPTLTARSNFDGSVSASFGWTFNDPNPLDTQGAFEIDINSASGVDYYGTGRLSGTLAYRSSGTASSAMNASLTPTLATGQQQGDLLVAVASIRNSGTGTVNTPSGWTALLTSGNVKVLGRLARPGDTAPTITFASGAASATTLSQTFAVSGTAAPYLANLADVVHAASAQLNGSAQNVAMPGLTITEPNCGVLALVWKQDDFTSASNPYGFSTFPIVNSSTVGDDACQFAAWGVQIAASSLSSATYTVSGGAAAISRGILMAFKPYPASAAVLPAFTLPASTLTQPSSWQWRVKTWDAAGLEGTWSNYSTFSTGAGAVVTVTDPASDNPPEFIYSSYGVDWSVTGATQADYRVTVVRTDTEANVYTSGWVTSAATTHTVTGLVSDVEQRIEVTVRTSGLIESNTGTRLVTPIFAAPEAPIVTVTEVPDSGHTLVSVTHPTPTGDHPDAVEALVLRRATTGPGAGEDWVTVGALLPGSTWADYTAGAVTYEYSAQAVAADGTTTQADEEVTATLALLGLWIHDPTDPSDVVDSVRQYTYGGAAKSLGIDTLGVSSHYVGRTDPVVDYGEHQDEQFSVSLQIPHGTDWLTEGAELQNFAESRTTLCTRDNRGRRIFGVIEGYSENDQDWGTAVSFTVRRVSYDETYTGNAV